MGPSFKNIKRVSRLKYLDVFVDDETMAPATYSQQSQKEMRIMYGVKRFWFHTFKMNTD